MLARDTKAPPKPKADKAAPPKPTGPHVTIEGIGVIPLESFQWGSHHGPGGHGGGQPQVTEMQLSSKIGPHSNDLFRATLSGEAHDAEIVYPTKDGELRIKLKGAMVSSYSRRRGKDAMESWSLNFTGVAFKRPWDGEARQDDVRAWDLGERYPGWRVGATPPVVQRLLVRAGEQPAVAHALLRPTVNFVYGLRSLEMGDSADACW